MAYLDGIIGPGLWIRLVATLVMVQLTIMAVTLYLHRDQAHRGLDLHPAVRHFFRMWIWLSSGMGTREWVAVHRKHHARCETEDDPHSPQILGLRKVLLEGAELYRMESKRTETLEKYGRGCPDDWMERNVYSRFTFSGVVIMAAADLVLFGISGIPIFGVQMLAMPLFAAGVVNGLGHHSGYRNFECDDAATNITPLAIFLGGEELHNNHHAFPSSAKFSIRRWEFDIGWLYIKVLSTLGLARVRRVAPRPVIHPSARQVDIETLRAVIVNRMHVLRDYTRRVTLPVLDRELATAPSGRWQAVLRKARTLVIRQPKLLDEQAQQRLRELLEQNQALRTVHEYRDRLIELWSASDLSNERLLAKLREWCAQAEASGIKALQDFAATLRSYRLQPA